MARKAYYSFLNDINIQSGAQISTTKKLFHTLVDPILLYNCEVWDSFLNPSWITAVFNLLSMADIKDMNLRSSEEINRSSTLKQIEITLKSIYEKRFFERIHNSKGLS